MHKQLKDDLKRSEWLLQATRDFAGRFLSAVDTLAADRPMPPFPAATLPAAANGAEHTLELFRQHFGNHLTAATGPRYWGFVTGGVTPAALVGDWLTSTFDLNAADNASVAFHIDKEALHLLRELFHLPDTFQGCFVTGATMANFTGLATARQWWGKQLGRDIALDGMEGLPTIKIVSAVPHSSSVKSMSMLGLGRHSLVKLPCLPGREALDISALEAWLQENGQEPFILVASAGTVNTVDYDDLAALVALKSKYNFWLHVDAAFGAFAACSPLYAHLLQGWEGADSITIDAHKWLNVPYDAGMIFCRHPQYQLDVFQNAGAAYLGDPAKNFNFINYAPENSRRLRSLPVWFSLMAYGRDGYRQLVEDNVEQAQQLGSWLTDHPHFTLLAPVNMCVACFTLKAPPEEQAALVDRFLRKLNADGVVYMTATHYAGQPAIRAALVNWRTEAKDVQLAIDAMQAALAAVLPLAEVS